MMSNTGFSRRRMMCRVLRLLLLLAALLVCVSAAGAETEAPLRFSVNGKETVALWEGDASDAYVFLPAWADLGTTTLLPVDGAEASIGQTPVTPEMSCADFALGQPYPLTLQGRQLTLTFLRSAHTAALFVRTDDGDMEHVLADKDFEADAAVTLYTADGTVDYASAAGDRIGGRGNSTWKLPKKPFNLKLGQKAGLLGMGDAKKWSLLANAYDETNLRNKLVLDFAREMAPYRGFSPECAFVDLYVNGGYQGLYLLCMSTKDVTKLFLDTKSEDAYEIELTMSVKVEEDAETIPLAPGMAAEAKHPSPLSRSQREQLEDIVDGVQRLARSGEDETGDVRIDTESWARKLLVEVVFENYDAPNASQFFWGSLSGRTVYAGPCWDYDLSMGLYYVRWSMPRAIMAFKDWNLGQDVSWYHGLWEKPEIRQRAVALYRDEVRSRLTDLLDQRIPAEADAIADAAVLDAARWPGLYTGHDSFRAAVADMAAFMRERMAFLDALWLNEAAFVQVTMKLPNTRMLHLYTPAGEPCPDLPLPCDVSLPGEGMEDARVWLNAATDEPFDPATPVTEDLVLYAVLPAAEEPPEP